MNRAELAEQLVSLVVGQSFGISKQITDDLFQPGLEDVSAFIAAANFAAEHQCKMTPAPGEIVFTKSDREAWRVTKNAHKKVIRTLPNTPKTPQKAVSPSATLGRRQVAAAPYFFCLAAPRPPRNPARDTSRRYSRPYG